jgi:hypothetical protein
VKEDAKMKKLILLVTLALAPKIAFATSIAPLFTSAIEFGGDKIVDVTYSDGSTSNIEAGRGLLLGGGLLFDLSSASPHRFEGQATLAIKWTGTKAASNGEVDWYRFPIELLGFYHNEEKNFRVGAGLTYQVGNEVKGTQAVAGAAMKFDNATGYVIEADYFVGQEKNAVIGARYTGISYKAQTSDAATINGNSFGVNFNYFWLTHDAPASSGSVSLRN